MQEGASGRMVGRILRCWTVEGRPESSSVSRPFPGVLLPRVLLSRILIENQLSLLDAAARINRRAPDVPTLNEQDLELRQNIAAVDSALNLMSQGVNEHTTNLALNSVRALHRTLQTLPQSPIFP
jgi:hypothetical protein